MYSAITCDSVSVWPFTSTNGTLPIAVRATTSSFCDGGTTSSSNGTPFSTSCSLTLL